MGKRFVLPLYLQKSIIKIICNQINKSNENMFQFLDGDIGLDYRERENETKLLMINIALVSSDWFEACSYYLNVAVDLNFGDRKYSIIKSNNFKTIKFHYNHEDMKFKVYTTNGSIKWYTMDNVEEIIKNNKSISKILIRNINFDQIDFTQLFNQVNKFTENKSISYYNYEITSSTILENHHKSILNYNGDNKVCVGKLIIENLQDVNTLLNFFKMTSNSIKDMDIDLQYTENNIAPISDGFKLFQMIKDEGFFKNLEQLNICRMDITLNDLSNILDNCKFIKNLSFNFCFNSFHYYLTPKQNRQNGINDIPCQCGSLIDSFSKNDEDICNGQFEDDWNKLITSIKNSIHLNQIEIDQCCSLEKGVKYSCSRGLKVPRVITMKIASLIASIPNLTVAKFHGCTSTDMYFEIASRNKLITNYIVTIFPTCCNIESYISKIKLFLNLYSHIKSFTLSQYVYAEDKNEIILEYKN